MALHERLNQYILHRIRIMKNRDVNPEANHCWCRMLQMSVPTNAQ